MKKFAITALAGLTALFCLSACSDDDDDSGSGSITGQWELTSASFTKSAVIGESTVTVYIDLAKGGSFFLSQIIGDGRYETFTGTWSLSDENILSGYYSDGTAWAASYEASVSGKKLTLITYPDGIETYTYTRCTIPDEAM